MIKIIRIWNCWSRWQRPNRNQRKNSEYLREFVTAMPYVFTINERNMGSNRTFELLTEEVANGGYLACAIRTMYGNRRNSAHSLRWLRTRCHLGVFWFIRHRSGWQPWTVSGNSKTGDPYLWTGEPEPYWCATASPVARCWSADVCAGALPFSPVLCPRPLRSWPWLPPVSENWPTRQNRWSNTACICHQISASMLPGINNKTDYVEKN